MSFITIKINLAKLKDFRVISTIIYKAKINCKIILIVNLLDIVMEKKTRFNVGCNYS